jgi:hypothetical protein
MLVFDLTPDLAASGARIVRLEMKFAQALPDQLVCLLYLEYDGSILIDALRNVTTDY